MALIVGVINPNNLDTDLKAAVETPADLLEFRADLIDGINPELIVHYVTAIRELTNIPVICTVRTDSEGGGFSGSLELLKQMYNAVVNCCSAIDVELSSPIANELIAIAHQANTPVIGSYHNFKITPEFSELVKIIDNAASLNVDIIKIATMCNTSDDLHNLIALHRTNIMQQKCLTIIGMGPSGSLLRLTAPALGSFLSYAYYTEKQAPGQLSVAETIEFWKRFNIERKTNLSIDNNELSKSCKQCKGNCKSCN